MYIFLHHRERHRHTHTNMNEAVQSIAQERASRGDKPTSHDSSHASKPHPYTYNGHIHTHTHMHTSSEVRSRTSSSSVAIVACPQPTRLCDSLLPARQGIGSDRWAASTYSTFREMVRVGPSCCVLAVHQCVLLTGMRVCSMRGLHWSWLFLLRTSWG